MRGGRRVEADGGRKVETKGGRRVDAERGVEEKVVVDETKELRK